MSLALCLAFSRFFFRHSGHRRAYIGGVFGKRNPDVWKKTRTWKHQYCSLIWFLLRGNIVSYVALCPPNPSCLPLSNNFRLSRVHVFICISPRSSLNPEGVKYWENALKCLLHLSGFIFFWKDPKSLILDGNTHSGAKNHLCAAGWNYCMEILFSKSLLPGGTTAWKYYSITYRSVSNWLSPWLRALRKR